MRLCRMILVVLFVQAGMSGAHSASAQVLELLVVDLATAGTEQTLTIPADAQFQVTLENLLPSARYSISIEVLYPDVDPLVLEGFTVGGEALAAAGAAPPVEMLKMRSAAPVCTRLINGFVSQVGQAVDENEVKEIVVKARANADVACESSLEQVVEALTHRTLMPETPAPGAEREVVITVVRDGSPGREWKLILTSSSRGEWRTSYGFTFVKDRDEQYFTSAIPDQAGKFRIGREADRERADFIPSIFFTWHGTGHRWGPAFGLGYDLESPALFVGAGWKYRQNVMLTGGLAIHSRKDLRGRYDKGDVVMENLGDEQLTESTYTPNFYLGATFRFGTNIHAQRAAALAKAAAARKQAADAARTAAETAKKAEEAAKKAEEEKKADLELCEKQHELTLAEALVACSKKPPAEVAGCSNVAQKKAEAEKAKCRLDALQKGAPGPASAGPGTPPEPVVPIELSDEPSDMGAAGSHPVETQTVAPVPSRSQRRCATPPLAPETRSQNLELMSQFRALNSDFAQKGGTIDIPVYFHVIHDGDVGRIGITAIRQQMEVLNRVYRPRGFSFTLIAADSVDQATWFRMGIGSNEELEAKARLGRRTTAALNIYSCDPPGYLGWATLPVWLRRFPVNDGVVIKYSSLPGGQEERYDLGHTAVHEVGHWLGLEHPFNGWDEVKAPLGGCNSPGDAIADTPYEASPADGPGVGQACPASGGRDTCPSPGTDLIENYMDYADDRCMREFTAGQVAWMKEQTALYRSLLLRRATGAIQSFVPLN
jgi:Pregnancy-associated plasma protein-A